MTLTNGTDVLGLAPGLLSSINLTIYSENSLLEDAILTGKLVKQASWSCNESTDISQRTCSLIHDLLRPAIDSEEDWLRPKTPSSNTKAITAGKSSHLPSPRLLEVLASLAAQTAVHCSEPEKHSKAIYSTAQCLISIIDVCLCSISHGQQETSATASQYLSLALAVSSSLPPILKRCGTLQPELVHELFMRLHPLLVSTASFAQLVKIATGLQQQILDPTTINDAFWEWMFPTKSPHGSKRVAPHEAGPALRLMDSLLTATTALLESSWSSSPSLVKDLVVPLAVLERGHRVLVLLFGRLLAALAGDDQLSTMLLPIFVDSVTSRIGVGIQTARVRLISVQTLGSMAVLCAQNNNAKGYDSAVELLCKFYKRIAVQGNGNIVIAGRRRSFLNRRATVASSQQLLKNMNSMESEERQLIATIGISLQRIAAGLKHAAPSYRKGFCIKLLELFSDCALMPPTGDSAPWLSHLVPAIAVAVSNYPQSRALTRSLILSDLSLDALSSLQMEEVTFTRLFRQFWLYAAVYDLGKIQASDVPGNRRIQMLHESIAAVAAGSPILLTGAEEQKMEVMAGHLDAEFGSRLAKLGELGSAVYLQRKLTTYAGVNFPEVLSPAQLAHLLTMAYKGIANSMHSKRLQSDMHDTAIKHVLIHLQTSHKDMPWFAGMKRILMKVFSQYMSQLLALSKAPTLEERKVAEEAEETLTQDLIAAMVPRHEEDDVPALASSLLTQLTQAFPGVQFKAATISALLHALAGEQAYNESVGANPQHFVQSWISRFSNHTMDTAPGPTRALVQEFVRALVSDRSGGGHVAVSRFTPELLQAVQRAQTKSARHSWKDNEQGMDVWTSMVHALGVVRGLSEVAVASGYPASSVVLRCTHSLLREMQGSDEIQAVHRMIEAAASLIIFRDNAMWNHTVQLIARMPATFFDTHVVHPSVSIWHWLMVVDPKHIGVLLMSEVTDAWLWTQQQQQGLFMNDTAPDSKICVPGAERDAIMSGIDSHDAWIVFFTEQWAVLKHMLPSSPPELTRSLWKMLQASLTTNDRPLTLYPGSCCARFRLLRLAVDLCCHCVEANFISVAAGAKLYADSLAAAFGWFEAPIAWFAGDKLAADDATTSVADFLRVIQATKSTASRLSLAPDGSGDPRLEGLASKLTLLEFLLDSEKSRLAVWSDPLHSTAQGPSDTIQSDAQWKAFIETAWSVSPALAFQFQTRFPANAAVSSTLTALVTRHAGDERLHSVPSAVEFLVTVDAIKRDAPELQELEHWAVMPPVQAMHLVATSIVRNHPIVRKYLVKSLLAADPEDVAFFLPQLVQLLRHHPETTEQFFVDAAAKSVPFAFLLICQLSAEGTPPAEAFNPAVKRSNWTPPVDSGIWEAADKVKQTILSSLPPATKTHLLAQLEFFGDVTAVSGKLYPVKKEERKAAAARFLKEIKIPRDDLFLPTDSHAVVTGIIAEGSAPMQSAAKCPILVPFEVARDGGSVDHAACIFKVGDDCRQDMLALQVISQLKGAFNAAGLDLHMKPYKVVPTAHEEGVIEVVPHAKSRAQLGELTDGGLFEIFQLEFGMPGSKRFERARRNFIISSAGYAVASYLLQAKDRHNGNIMIDNKGNIIHIDFGYILGISPGGNMGFESAAFKLSYEMTELLDPGNTRNSPTFLEFQELCVRGYLAARNVAADVITTVSLMSDSGLPCFGRGVPVEALKERFHLEMTAPQAATFMRTLIADAYDKWTTGVYDLIQYYQNAIPK